MPFDRKSIRAAALVFAVLGGGLFLVNGGARRLYNALPEAGVTKQKREDQEWERYKVEQQCRLTGREEIKTTHYPGTATRYGTIGGYTSTRTLYEWKCRGGDTHWH